MTFHYNRTRQFCLVLFTLAALFIHSSDETEVRTLPNIACQPLLAYVDVDPDYLFDPYVVKLHRCSGKQDSSKNKGCVARTTSNVTFQVDDFSGTGEVVLVTLQNHTSCHEQCKHNSSVCNENEVWDPRDCSCRCNVKEPQQCEDGFRWDPFRCSCVCPQHGRPLQCNKFKIFSEDTCACICDPKISRSCTKTGLYLDPDTCICTPPFTGAQQSRDCAHVSTNMILIIVSFVEAFLIIAAYVMCRRYCGHRDVKRCCKEKEKLDLELHEQGQSADKYPIGTPTIETHPGLSVLHVTKQHTNNNKLYGGKTNSPSCDALLNEQSTAEYLNGGGSNSAYDWRQSLLSSVKV